jgi:tRNA G18 (ribose-2'-O)-methylase SpoU
MSSPRKTTLPNLAANSPLHQAAIAAGDDHYYSYLYNVEDRFKDKTTEEIRKTLRETALPCAVCCEFWLQDFNLASCFRNCNAFNVREIFYLGEKRYDRRGEVGIRNYNDIVWLATVDEFIALKRRYRVVGADNIKGAVPLPSYKWQPESLIVFGSEGVGLTPTMQGLCDDIVFIPQRGSVRSLNAATASGIVLYDYSVKVVQ